MKHKHLKQPHLALAQECERLARESERKMLDPELNADQKMEFHDQAKAYWQMANGSVQSALSSEEERPTKFTKSQGSTGTTQKRKAFLCALIVKNAPATYDVLVADAVADGASEFWPDNAALIDTVMNFARKHRLLT